MTVRRGGEAEFSTFPVMTVPSRRPEPGSDGGGWTRSSSRRIPAASAAASPPEGTAVLSPCAAGSFVASAQRRTGRNKQTNNNGIKPELWGLGGFFVMKGRDDQSSGKGLCAGRLEFTSGFCRITQGAQQGNEGTEKLRVIPRHA